MELGNLIFGHSRGEYSIPRTKEWEIMIISLLYVCSEDSFLVSPPSFENKVFLIFPYYWGDCTCGYQEKEEVN